MDLPGEKMPILSSLRELPSPQSVIGGGTDQSVQRRAKRFGVG